METESTQAFYPENDIPTSLAEFEGDTQQILDIPKVGEVTPLLVGNEFNELSQFPTLKIGNLPEALAIFQGGMGLSISNGEMAGQVAKEGGFGTVTSVQFDTKEKKQHTEANRAAFAREIQLAKIVAKGNGVIGVNIMHALGDYPDLVKTALENKADFLAVGAGLALDLAELTEDYPEVALLPIVSGGRALTSIIKRWKRNGRKPDAIIYENPLLAGGHEGGKRDEILENNPQYFYRYGLAQVFDALHSFGEEYENIPVVAAGGINPQDLTYILNLRNERNQRVAGIQIATPFLTTDVAGITARDKQADIERNESFVKTHMKHHKTALIESTAGKMPGRVLLNEFVMETIAKLQALQNLTRENFKQCVDCLSNHCEFDTTQWCIMQRLSLAQQGKEKAGLFFTGRNPQHIGKTTVGEVIARYTSIPHPLHSSKILS